MAWTVGAAIRNAVSLGVRRQDNVWVVGVEVEPAAVLGGAGHVTGYALDLRLVAADDMVRVALRLMVEGTVVVAKRTTEIYTVERNFIRFNLDNSILATDTILHWRLDVLTTHGRFWKGNDGDVGARAANGCPLQTMHSRRSMRFAILTAS